MIIISIRTGTTIFIATFNLEILFCPGFQDTVVQRKIKGATLDQKKNRQSLPSILAGS